MGWSAPSSHILLFAIVPVLISIVNATQVLRRSDEYAEQPADTGRIELSLGAPSASVIYQGRQSSVQPRQGPGGRVNAAYFTNWSIYGGFHPNNIPAADLTHILYSFADTNSSSGALKLSDLFADVNKRFEGDLPKEGGTHLYGCLKQMYLHKLANRNVKVLLSVGGWAYSQAGHFKFVTNPTARSTFVKDAIRFIEDYGFDGIDIDFEYPSNKAQGQGFADLLTALRIALSQLAQRKGDSVPYQLTVAVAAGASNYQHLNVPQMEAALTFWNLMAYDYAGSWSSVTGHHANLYGPTSTGVSTDSAVRWYLSKGATAWKLNHGMPMYGRAFQNTNGIYQPYRGVGSGTFESGVYPYKGLPIAGAQVIHDVDIVASYSYDPRKRELVSFDDPDIIRLKTKYTIERGLGGNFFWEISQDALGNQAISRASRQALGTLDQTENHIHYPNSKYDNIKSNMGRGSAAPTPTPTPTPTPPPAQSCGGIAPWSAAKVYHGGQRASYTGCKWTAKWWTQGETPGSADVWTNTSAC